MQLLESSALVRTPPQLTNSYVRRVCAFLVGCAMAGLTGCGDAPGPGAKSGGGDLPSGPPQTELAAAFEASSAPIFEARTPAELGQIRAGNQASVAASDAGVRIVATGDDPTVALPPFAAGKKFILQVMIDSPAATGIQLFHLAGAAKDYSVQASQSSELQAGPNTVYFAVTADDLKDPLRLDPGYTPGEYTIRSLVAREWAPPKTN